VSEGGMDRRRFFGRVGKIGGAMILGSMAGKAFAGEWEQGTGDELWSAGSFRQSCIDISRELEGIVRGRIDGEWREFSKVTLPDPFMEWNLAARREVLESIGRMMAGGEGSGPSLAGPHNAAMATYSALRRDSNLTINNAYKGMGLCPERGKIGGYIEHMQATVDSASMPERLEFLGQLYSDKANFDLTRLVSLELYSTPDFETHTFLNLMENPATSLVFLDSMSYEVRGLGELVDPGDSEALQYSRDIMTYTNLAHSYFHGAFPRLFPAIIIHITEIFDNSPGTGLGVRVAPPLP